MLRGTCAGARFVAARGRDGVGRPDRARRAPLRRRRGFRVQRAPRQQLWPTPRCAPVNARGECGEGGRSFRHGEAPPPARGCALPTLTSVLLVRVIRRQGVSMVVMTLLPCFLLLATYMALNTAESPQPQPQVAACARHTRVPGVPACRRMRVCVRVRECARVHILAHASACTFSTAAD